MNCLKYKVRVAESPFAAIHNMYFDIEEIFCPEARIAFNSSGFVLELKEHRAQSEIKQIEIADSIVERFLEQLKIEKFNKDVIESFFKKES